MGVLECGRRGCESIMSERYSSEYGYICRYCFEELVNRGPTTDIESFMESKKKPNQEEEARARFDKVFRVRSSLMGTEST